MPNPKLLTKIHDAQQRIPLKICIKLFTGLVMVVTLVLKYCSMSTRTVNCEP